MFFFSSVNNEPKGYQWHITVEWIVNITTTKKKENTKYLLVLFVKNDEVNFSKREKLWNKKIIYWKDFLFYIFVNKVKRKVEKVNYG